MVAGEQKAGELAQRVGVDAERGERGQCFFGELLCQRLRGIETEQGRVGRFLVELVGTGLLAEHGTRGFVVRAFTVDDVLDAIDVRAALEGLAARLAAERGVRSGLLAQARECLAQIDLVLRDSALDDETFSAYVELNGQFHKQLSEMADSAVLAREIERAASLPFASASGFVGVEIHNAQARDNLVVAQHQHRQVLDAIERREAGRAEAIMREHSRIARQNMQVALRDPAASGTPGVQLIRPS